MNINKLAMDAAMGYLDTVHGSSAEEFGYKMAVLELCGKETFNRFKNIIGYMDKFEPYYYR